MELSLVIPCYNEIQNLKLLIYRLREVFDSEYWEVILVDNGSTDGTWSFLNNIIKDSDNIKIFKIEKNIGYGDGIFKGIKETSGEIISWTHADMQTDPVDVKNGLTQFEDFDKEIFVKGLRIKRNFWDQTFTVGMSFFEYLLLNRFMWDINAQPTMFSKQFLSKLNCPPSDYSLDLYAYYKAVISDIPIKRFKVEFKNRAHGLSHWNTSFKSKLKFINKTVNYSYKLKRDF